MASPWIRTHPSSASIMFVALLVHANHLIPMAIVVLMMNSTICRKRKIGKIKMKMKMKDENKNLTNTDASAAGAAAAATVATTVKTVVKTKAATKQQQQLQQQKHLC